MQSLGMILKLISECFTPSKNKELVSLSVNSGACVAGEELCLRSEEICGKDNVLPESSASISPYVIYQLPAGVTPSPQIWLMLHPGWGDSPSRIKISFSRAFSYGCLWRKCLYLSHEAL